MIGDNDKDGFGAGRLLKAPAGSSTQAPCLGERTRAKTCCIFICQNCGNSLANDTARNARIPPPPDLAGSHPSGTDTRPIYVPNPRSGRRTLQRTGYSLENSASCLSVTQMYSLENRPFASRFSGRTSPRVPP